MNPARRTAPCRDRNPFLPDAALDAKGKYIALTRIPPGVEFTDVDPLA